LLTSGNFNGKVFEFKGGPLAYPSYLIGLPGGGAVIPSNIPILA